MGVELIIGLFVGGFIVTLISIAIFVFNLLNDMKYQYEIDIENNNSGKSVHELYRAKKMLHPQLGEIYYVPKLKAVGRPYIQCDSTTNECPLINRGPRKFVVHVSYRDGAYVPIKSEPTYKEKRTVIEMVTENGKTVPKKIEKEVTVNVTKPLKTSNRQFTLFYDDVIKEEYKKPSDFWTKYGPYVIALGMIAIAAGVAICILVFTTEAAKNIPTAPGLADAVAQKVVQMSQNVTNANAAPPSTLQIPGLK